MTELLAEPDLLLVRTFQADIGVTGDGRTLEGLVVPFDRETDVADPPEFRVYRESIAPGAFRAATKAPNRVLLDFEHYGAMNDAVGSMGSIQGTLGHAVELSEQTDGLYGRFRMLPGPDGDKALDLAREGVLGAFSVAMRPLRTLRSDTGTLRRLKAHLDRVSLCRVGAYPEARVTAIRAGHVLVDQDETLAAFSPELAEKFRTLGLAVPDRFAPASSMRQGSETDAIRALNLVIGALAAYVKAEPDPADRAEAQAWLDGARTLLAKDRAEAA